jgi:hypothetical protein
MWIIGCDFHTRGPHIAMLSRVLMLGFYAGGRSELRPYG